MDEGTVEFLADWPEETSCLAKRVGLDQKIVPGIRRSIESLVHIWRFGDSDFDLPPTRELRDVERRNGLISNYSDSSWRNNGHKDSLFRIMRIMKSLCDEIGMSLGSDDDELWNRAIELLSMPSAIIGRSATPPVYLGVTART